MQRLCVLVTMGACLVASTPEDVALTVQRGSVKLHLASRNLTELHSCICTDAHVGCELTDGNVIPTRLQASQYTSSTQYLNVYRCTLYPTYAVCTRSNQSLQERVDVQRKSNSFSLHNTDTCDISCVDVIWDDSDTLIKLYTNNTNAELCSKKSLSDIPNMTHTTTIIISIVASCLVFIIISVIIIICVCIKRKNQLKKPAVYTVKSQTCSYREVDKNCGLYAVSPSWHPDPEQDSVQEPLYFEVEKDKLDPQEFRESIHIETNNLYSQLHDKTENVMNEYDVLPR